MGFVDTVLNVRALTHAGGQVGPALDWLLQQFARLGPARVPISLWWHDPQQLLKVTWGAAFRLGWLWILLLICLETGRIHAPQARIRTPQSRQTGNLKVGRKVAGRLSGLNSEQ